MHLIGGVREKRWTNGRRARYFVSSLLKPFWAWFLAFSSKQKENALLHSIKRKIMFTIIEQ